MATARDYLLDTNVISTLIRGPTDPLNKTVSNHFAAIESSHVWIPVIVIAEIEFGLAIVDRPDLPESVRKQRREINEFLAKYEHIGINDHTIEPYTLVRAQVFKIHATPKPSGRGGYVERRPGQLFDRVTAESLEIDERDLLIVSIAIQYNFILATLDQEKGMNLIIKAAHHLEQDGKQVHLEVEYWNT